MIRSLVLTLAIFTASMGLSGCSSVKPAGSLGYMVNGDPLARPIPTNYRHVAPTTESAGLMRFQSKF